MYAFICVILMFFGGLVPQALVPQQKPDGFLQYSWGIAKTDSLVKQLNLVYSGRNTAMYQRYTAQNITQYGKAQVLVYFYFYKDQLSAVGLKTAGTQNAVYILDELTRIYGKGTQPSKWIEQYKWGFSGTFIDHDFNTENYSSFTLFRSQKLDYIQSEDRSLLREKDLK